MIERREEEGNMVIQSGLLTAEAFWEQYVDQHYELVKGVPVAMSPTGAIHQIVSLACGRLIGNYLEAHPIGYAGGSEGGFLLSRDPDVMRAPDASFISFDRLPPGPLSESYMPVPPDLAVEVVSPHDRANDIAEKVNEYLSAGTRLVWVIYPMLKEVQVYRANGTGQRLSGSEQLGGEDVLPGLTIALSELWPIERPTQGS